MKTIHLAPNMKPARGIMYVWSDGRRAFLNYACLVVGEFDPNGEKNRIRLSFSSHSVMLQGYSLESLFVALLDHLARIITAIDPRYVLKENRQDSVIVEIVLEK